MTENPLKSLLNEFMTSDDHEDISLSLGEIIICINYREPQPLSLEPEMIDKLITTARDWSTCEDDPDYHIACSAIHTLGLFKPDDSEVYKLLEESLLNIDAPRCVQNHAARALGEIGTPPARNALKKAEETAAEWAQRKGHETFTSLIDIIRKELTEN